MKPTHELTEDEWLRMVRDPMFAEVKTLDFTGGEATLTPDFLKKVKICLDHMPKVTHVTMVSNGLAPVIVIKRVEELLKLLAKRKISLNVSVSLDGVDKMHETIRRIPNAFTNVTTTIFELQKLSRSYPSLSVSVGALMLHQNIDHVDELTEWLEAHDIKFGWQIVGFHDTYVRNLDTEVATDFTKEDKPKLIRILTKLSQPKSWKDVRAYYWRDLLGMYRDHLPRSTPCPFLHDQCAVDSLGYVYNCFSTDAIGNIRDGQTPSELYYSQKNLTYRKTMWNSVCRTCNSGCSASEATAKDLFHYVYFRLTGRPLV